MKRMIKNLAAVIGYMLLLCMLLKTDAILLFSPRHIGMFLLGSVILCVPYMEKQIKWRDFQRIFKRNAVTAGYLETFMLIFVSMMQGEISQGEILPDLALDLRPLFYGFVCSVVLKEESKASCFQKEKEALENEEWHEVSKEEKAGGEPDFSKLTRQEKVVAELVKRGLSNREIGEELCIAESTVKKHLSNIFDKLEIDSRRELK